MMLVEEIQQRVNSGQGFALLYADLDHFKAYNDRYGFERGDHAIQMLANILSKLGIENRIQAAVIAVQAGLVTGEMVSNVDAVRAVIGTRPNGASGR